MLDSPEGVCPGQAGFKYPATSALFSKSAKQAGSGPAARRRTRPSTRTFACRDYPLLSAGCCQSVPPMCPSFLSRGRTSQAP
jgi:hypothetical protein